MIDATKVFIAGFSGADALSLFNLWHANLMSQLEQCDPKTPQKANPLRYVPAETMAIHRDRVNQALGILRSVHSRLEAELGQMEVKSGRCTVLFLFEDIEKLLSMFASFGVDPKRGSITSIIV